MNGLIMQKMTLLVCSMMRNLLISGNQVLHPGI
jgi:hypothetical protein